MNSAMLLFSTLLVLLQNANCLSVGQPCNILAVTDQCDPGLTCVAQGTTAHCQSINQQACDLATCSPVWCNSNLQYTPEGECCPICPPQPTLHTSPVSTGCRQGGHDYSEGEEWNPNQDPCITCTCTNGFPLCQAIGCAPLPCENVVYLPGQCCPVCVEAIDISKECHVDNKIYQDGERWQITGCQWAICVEGEVLQYSHQCAAPECDNPIYLADTCCPICSESREATGEPVSTPVPTPLVPTPLVPTPLIPAPVPTPLVPTPLIPAPVPTPLVPTPLIPAPVPTPLTPAPVCMLENGGTLNDGETYCPQPNVLGTCNLGQVEYENHCRPLTCANLIRGPNDCDCPICVDDAQQFQIAGLLDMPLRVYARKAQKVENMIRRLVTDAGFIFMHVIAYGCNSDMCFDINVASPDDTITLDDHDVVTAVRNELNSVDHKGLEIGYMGDFNTRKRSARSVSDSEPLSSSSSSTDQHSSSTTTTVIAVTASVFGVFASVIGVALLASFVHRKQTAHHSITV